MLSIVQMKLETFAPPNPILSHHWTVFATLPRNYPIQINITLDALSMSSAKTSKMERKLGNGLIEHVSALILVLHLDIHLWSHWSLTFTQVKYHHNSIVNMMTYLNPLQETKHNSCQNLSGNFSVVSLMRGIMTQYRHQNLPKLPTSTSYQCRKWKAFHLITHSSHLLLILYPNTEQSQEDSPNLLNS